jgi:hypothetical protein
MTNAAVAVDGGTAMTDVCAVSTIVAALAAADQAYDGNTTPNQVTKCNDSDTTWAACSALKVDDDYYCVDSSGKKVQTGVRTDCVTAWALTACP